MVKEKVAQYGRDILTIAANRLDVKQEEYASYDGFHNFNIAAKLQNITSEEALAGMMAKHTVSIYDMIHSCEKYDIEYWEEKIGDNIEYLALLYAMMKDIEETKKKK